MFTFSDVPAGSNHDMPQYNSLTRGQAFYLLGDPARDQSALRIKSKKGHTTVTAGDGTDPNGHNMASGNYIKDDKIDPQAHVRLVNIHLSIADGD